MVSELDFSITQRLPFPSSHICSAFSIWFFSTWTTALTDLRFAIQLHLLIISTIDSIGHGGHTL